MPSSHDHDDLAPRGPDAAESTPDSGPASGSVAVAGTHRADDTGETSASEVTLGGQPAPSVTDHEHDDAYGHDDHDTYDDHGYHDHEHDDHGYHDPTPDDGPLAHDDEYPEYDHAAAHEAYDDHEAYDEHEAYADHDHHERDTHGHGRFLSFCRRHRVLTGVVIVLLPLFCLLSFSWVKAMTKEGSESFLAKNVQWVRDNNGGFIVDRVEQWYYAREQPESGGTPDAIAAPSTLGAPGGPPTTAPPGQKAVATTAPLPKHIEPPAPLKSPVPTPIENEGAWSGAGPDMGGGLRPMYYTKVRPNAEKTSLLVFVAWIDPNLAKLELHPGTELPGGKWLTPTRITEENCGAAIAGLNSGFRMDQARGGYYAEGRTQQALRPGAASMVFYKDGRVDVANWGRDVGPDQLPTINAVRQNLDLLVDNGAPVPDIDKKDWGALLPNSYFIWRTAFGVTKDGAIVYVGGPALQPRDLAQRLIDAGAVRAMEMDINPEWMTANLYSKGADGKCRGVKGLEGSQDKGGQRQPADRYLSTDTRDFVAIYSKQP